MRKVWGRRSRKKRINSLRSIIMCLVVDIRLRRVMAMFCFEEGISNWYFYNFIYWKLLKCWSALVTPLLNCIHYTDILIIHKYYLQQTHHTIINIIFKSFTIIIRPTSIHYLQHKISQIFLTFLPEENIFTLTLLSTSDPHSDNPFLLLSICPGDWLLSIYTVW